MLNVTQIIQWNIFLKAFFKQKEIIILCFIDVYNLQINKKFIVSMLYKIFSYLQFKQILSETKKEYT